MRKFDKSACLWAVQLLCLSCMCAWPCATQAADDQRTSRADRTITIKRRGVIVKITGIEKTYGEAFAAILSEAQRAYEKTLGLSLPKTLEMDAKLDPQAERRLWTDGESHIFLTVESEADLAPSTQSGVFLIYGLCHELGHMAMYRRMRNLAGLPDGVGEGWAHYAGSVVVDEVARRLGQRIWPEPYDAAGVEGLARLKKQSEDPNWEGPDPIGRAAKVFYEIEKKHGRGVLCKAMDMALSKEPSGKELMPLLVESLCKLTRDENAGDWVPKEVMRPETKWNVKERDVNEDFFAQLKISKDRGGVLLYYDDGTAEGSASSAGSGHAVLFKKPEGNWAMDSILVFGSRYGSPKPPNEDFQVYVCNEDFDPVLEADFPYSLFERGEKRWVKISLDPVRVPERFYVCVSFHPTATKGVHMAYDKGVARSHSRSALPFSHVADVPQTYDWMIRAHLRKARGK